MPTNAFKSLAEQLNSSRPSTFMNIKELTLNKSYPIIKMAHVNRGYGQSVEAELEDVSTETDERNGAIIVTLPKRYNNLLNKEALEKYTPLSIGLIYKGCIGRAYDLSFEDLSTSSLQQTQDDEIFNNNQLHHLQ